MNERDFLLKLRDESETKPTMVFMVNERLEQIDARTGYQEALAILRQSFGAQIRVEESVGKKLGELAEQADIEVRPWALKTPDGLTAKLHPRVAGSALRGEQARRRDRAKSLQDDLKAIEDIIGRLEHGES